MSEIRLTVPPHLADFLNSPLGARTWMRRMRPAHPDSPFAGTDSRERKLGSGGRTVNVLHPAWRAMRQRDDLGAWLTRTQKLAIQAGGESRCPSVYASISKALLPLLHREGLHPQKRLDPGTTTPEIEGIIDHSSSDLTACKLLGAGGGG